MKKLFRISIYSFSFCLIFLFGMFPCSKTSAQPLKQDSNELTRIFQNPPELAKSWVFWYWMKGAVTRKGITTDLEAMKQAGLIGAYLVPIQEATNPPLVDPPVNTLTPEWWGMIRFAFQEAERLGLQFTMHFGDGFATAGGTWITPELSMQKVTWSEVHTAGSKLFSDSLPQPPSNQNYYRDIAILAFPSPEGTGISTATVQPKITTSTGANASFLIKKNNKEIFHSDDPCWIQYEFAQPFTCRSVITRGATYSYQSHRLRIETSDDGVHFKSLCRLDPARNGWLDTDVDYTHSIPAATARYFRFYYDKEGSEPGGEDNDMAKWKPNLKLKGLELSSAAVINQYEGKSGVVWRLAKKTPASELTPAVCVPLDKIIDITDKFQNGKLTWSAPAGKWTILRVGYTTTGHQNMTAGTGKGLECDKFNPAVVKLQFDNWYGDIRKKMGDSLTSKVLKNIHVDSWECGSQNWSPIFRDEFIKRRGYDPKLYLPAMAGIPIQNTEVSERFLHDVLQTIDDLVTDNFFGTLDSLAKKNGYTFSSESEAPVMTGDGMGHYRKVDFPMGEFWVNSPTHDKPTDMLDAVSGAHIYGKNVVQSEAFTTLRMDWNEYPGMLKALGDRNYALGINRFVFHVFCHNPWPDRKPGMTLGPTGLFFQPNQTWWKPGKAWMEDYTQRCQALLQYGKPVVDIAVFTGEELPRRAVLPERLINTLPGLIGTAAVAKERKRLENTGVPMWNKPDGVQNNVNISDPADWTDPLRGYKYDSFNPDALFNLATVKNGNIELPGGASYKLLVLPQSNPMIPDTTLSAKARECVRQLQRQGAKVIRQWNDSTLDALGITRDVIFTDSAKALAGGFAWSHRTAPDADIYFISNQQNKLRNIVVSLHVAGRVPELWNPVNGEILTAGEWDFNKGRTELPLRLDANESLFIVLQKPTKENSSKKGLNWIESKPLQELTGSWSVKFDTAYGGPVAPVIFDKLEDWCKRPEFSIKYYSGTAVYSQNFQWKGKPGKSSRIWLDLGKVLKIAEVKVNGIACGVAWTAPYRVDISNALKSGNNRIEIAVTNTWINRLIGDSLVPENQRVTYTVGPVYRLDTKKIDESGLFGPVKIIIEQRAKNKEQRR